MSENVRIGVLGAGVMGSGIAQVMAIAGHEVICYDVAEEALEKGRAIVDTGRFGVKGAVERGKLTADEADAALARLTFSADLDQAAAVDVVIEAVPERLDLKISVFRDLDRKAPEATILASNSSGFPIQALAAATDRADRVVGWHWASPAPVMKLAEIVRGPQDVGRNGRDDPRPGRRGGQEPGRRQGLRPATGATWPTASTSPWSPRRPRSCRRAIADREQVDQLMVDCFRWPTGPFGMTRGAGSGWS